MITVAVHPDWVSILTAIGTAGAAIAAVGIAIWGDWRTGKRLREQLDHSDEQLREQFKHSDEQLADERAVSAQRIADERAHSDTRLKEERRLAQEREQFAEAYSVRVIRAERNADPIPGEADGQAEHLGAIVINHGNYTITIVEARLRLADGSLLVQRHRERVPRTEALPDSLRGGMTTRYEAMMYADWLTLWDAGLRFESDPISTRFVPGAYWIVRWTDRWGTRWEHRLDQVQPIEGSPPWGATGIGEREQARLSLA